MKFDKASPQSEKSEVSVYECEIHLKFRLIEDKTAFSDRSELRLDRMLLQPFRDDVGSYPICRRGERSSSSSA